jgi:hypothetical protein
MTGEFLAENPGNPTTFRWVLTYNLFNNTPSTKLHSDEISQIILVTCVNFKSNCEKKV